MYSYNIMLTLRTDVGAAGMNRPLNTHMKITAVYCPVFGYGCVGAIRSYILDICVRVSSDWKRPHQFDGVKHDAVVLEHMLINRRIHTGRTAL